MTQRQIDVVAAVIEEPDGRFLLARRPEGKVYAGYWEFPGGKVEANERFIDALIRELREELGIEVEAAYPWIVRSHVYEHSSVKLHFHRITRWRGIPRPQEGQSLSWQSFPRLSVSPMLPANAPVLKALQLPLSMGITHAWQVGVDTAIRELQIGLSRGLRFVQVREMQLAASERKRFARCAIDAVRESGGIVVVNGDKALADATGAGLHLTSVELMKLRARPNATWCGASCHDADQLSKARELELDYVILGPVNRTPTHPNVVPMGWEKFAKLIREYPLPVFALGGMRSGDLECARKHGGHGVAMIRGAWE